MTACSRCGATDDRHSVKCYQAMALGLAMGVEERPAAAGQLSDGQISEIGRQYAAPLREQLAAYAEEVQRLRTENEQFRRALDHEGEKLVALQAQLTALTSAPVTQLPDGYYDNLLAQQAAEAAVSPERLADIEREVAALNESPLLDVTVHDGLNATIRPKQLARDDDYTPEAIDRQTAAEEADEAPAPEPVAEVAPEPEPTPTEVEEAFHAADMARHEAPEPEPAPDEPDTTPTGRPWSTGSATRTAGPCARWARCWAATSRWSASGGRASGSPARSSGPSCASWPTGSDPTGSPRAPPRSASPVRGRSRRTSPPRKPRRSSSTNAWSPPRARAAPRTPTRGRSGCTSPHPSCLPDTRRGRRPTASRSSRPRPGWSVPLRASRRWSRSSGRAPSTTAGSRCATSG
jgi:hypothetical protein